MAKISIYLLIFLLLISIPEFCSASQGVIGQDNTFNLKTVKVLVGSDPMFDVFNYFFTIQLFFGAFAFFIKTCLRVARWNSGL